MGLEQLLSDGENKSIFDKRERLNIKCGGKCKSLDNKNRSGMHLSSPKIKRLRRSNAIFHLLKPSVRNSKKRRAQARKQMKLRTMWSTILVAAKARSSKRGLTDSFGASYSIE